MHQFYETCKYSHLLSTVFGKGILPEARLSLCRSHCRFVVTGITQPDHECLIMLSSRDKIQVCSFCTRDFLELSKPPFGSPASTLVMTVLTYSVVFPATWIAAKKIEKLIANKSKQCNDKILISFYFKGYTKTNTLRNTYSNFPWPGSVVGLRTWVVALSWRWSCGDPLWWYL